MDMARLQPKECGDKPRIPYGGYAARTNGGNLRARYYFLVFIAVSRP